jgi:hypothetical protein
MTITLYPKPKQPAFAKLLAGVKRMSMDKLNAKHLRVLNLQEQLRELVRVQCKLSKITCPEFSEDFIGAHALLVVLLVRAQRPIYVVEIIIFKKIMS